MKGVRRELHNSARADEMGGRLAGPRHIGQERKESQIRCKATPTTSSDVSGHAPVTHASRR